jgi:hypothetical protein
MKKQFIIIAAFVLALSTNAQNVKTYNDQMTKPEWIAELFHCEGGINGSYSYYEDEEENRILHGAFKVSYNTMCIDGRSLIEISGSYNHGKRNGHWAIRDKNRKTGKDNPYYYYDFNYKDGSLDGKIAFRDDGHEMAGKFVNGTLSDTVLFRTYSPFGTSKSIKGRVNLEGVPHGVWVEKNEYKNAVPMETTRLYYNGCLVYRREKDLSSGKITDTYQVSDKIKTPSDLNKIHDTTIDGVKYVDVGGIICGVKEGYYDPNDFFHFRLIYKAIENWCMTFDTNSYVAYVEKKEMERQRRVKDSLRVVELERKRIEQERQRIVRDSIRRVKEIGHQDEQDIAEMEALVFRMVQEHKLNFSSGVLDKLQGPSYHFIPTEKLKKCIKDGEYLVLSTEDGKEFHDIFKEEYLTTQSGKVIDQQRISKEYEVRVATNQDGNLLIVYDIQERIPFMLAHFNGKSSIRYYTIKKSIGKKIKQ